MLPRGEGLTRYFPNTAIEPGSVRAFIEYKCPRLPYFLEFISQPGIQPFVDSAYNFHNKDKRKATGDPYFKHLFYTAYLSWMKGEEFSLDENSKTVLVAASLLHDYIELRKKEVRYDETIFYHDLTKSVKPKDDETFENLRRIVTLTSFMTPHPKPKDQSKEAWISYKVNGFQEIMAVTRLKMMARYGKLFHHHQINPEEAERLTEILGVIKIADEMANIEETVDDVVYYRDGKEIKGMKPIDWRIEVFRKRRAIIDKLYARYTVADLFAKQKDDLVFLTEVN